MRRHLAVFLVVLFLISTAQTVQSNSSGKTGSSSSGCTCHGASSSMSVSLNGLPSSGYSGNTAYSLSWDGGPNIHGSGGFNIIATTNHIRKIVFTGNLFLILFFYHLIRISRRTSRFFSSSEPDMRIILL